MSEGRSLRLLLPRPVRELPADLATVVLATVLTCLVTLAPVVSETPARIPFGFGFVLFVPGYAVTTALYPESAEPVGGDAEHQRGPLGPSRIDRFERLALSVTLSVTLVPAVALVLDATPVGLQTPPLLLTLYTGTLVATVVAAVRRRRLPREERFRIPYRRWLATGRRAVFDTNTRLDAAVSVLVVVSVLFAAGSAGYVAIAPQDGEKTSALYLLTEEGGADVEEGLVAGDYPVRIPDGGSETVVLGVDNDEHRTVEYTVVGLEQRFDVVGNETRLVDQRERDRFAVELGHGERWQQPRPVEPTAAADRVRYVWLLYPEGAPAEPTRENAHAAVHLWVTVADADSSIGGSDATEARAP